MTRSAMWAIGRYDTSRLPVMSSMPNAWRSDSAVQVTLWWVSITPLGGPVVPDV